MTQTRALSFKIATDQSEFEQIHKLNYQAFVVEIPQHPPNAERLLVDRFHGENTYVICKCGDRVLGMTAIREKRPFSLDQKLEGLESFLPEHRAVCELRLLAVDREHRNSRVFQGLLLKVCDYCEGRGYDLAVMSGTIRQLKLYHQLGFVPFGPLVGSGEALFQPMYLTLNAYQGLKARSRTFLHLAPPPSPGRGHVALLPGPVAISQPVRQSFGEAPVSHRSKAFMEEFAQTKQLLCRLVGARHAEILLGSGTLANDVIAGQLSLIAGSGLVLSNGEFGNRLIDHATRFRLRFKALRTEWGEAFNPDDIRKALKEKRAIDWLWAVHCETSSGILNDIELLNELCAPRGIRLCLDCISSVGTVPVDLSEAFLASCVSGKGLAAYPGLAIVFYNHEVVPAQHALPRYLDLAMYAACEGVPFTTSSNLVYALLTALQRFEPGRFEAIGALSSWLRSELRKSGFQIIGASSPTSPAVTTIVLPETISSEWAGRKLNEAGYQLSYRSRYLRARNWIQICLMGEVDQESLIQLVALLTRLCAAAGPQERAAHLSP
ncbi:MAG: aminotransferase class V-fold PLP-dependent enzyme [Acidobacteriia bacterium]|nr:aminotransferase class V-fold PLP-dependent enzyme [Terriglobia bacterium]